MILLMLGNAAQAAPDLRITYGQRVGLGQDGDLYVEVNNVGDQASGGFWIDVFFDLPEAPVLGMYADDYVWVGSVPAYGRRSVTVPLDDGFLEGWGAGWMDVIIDTDEAIAEWNERNNILSIYHPSGGSWMTFTVHYSAEGNVTGYWNY